MIGVYNTDSLLQALVEGRKADVLWVTRLIDRVVACDPRVPLVSLGNYFPQPYGAVLVVFVVPERGPGGVVVGVPVLALSTWHCVHIQNCVDAMLAALFDISPTSSNTRNLRLPKEETYEINNAV